MYIPTPTPRFIRFAKPVILRMGKKKKEIYQYYYGYIVSGVWTVSYYFILFIFLGGYGR